MKKVTKKKVGAKKATSIPKKTTSTTPKFKKKSTKKIVAKKSSSTKGKKKISSMKATGKKVGITHPRKKFSTNTKTEAYQSKFERSDPYDIEVTFGTVKQKIQVLPQFGVLGTRIFSAFGWTNTQKAGILITGLKNKDGKVVEFEEEESLAFELAIKPNIKLGRRVYFFKPDEQYELLIEDIREAPEKNLTPKDIERIKKQYEKMDADGNGKVEISEIKMYYNNQFELSKKKWKKWLSMKVKQSPKMKKAYQMVKDEAIKRDDLLKERNIQFYIEQDVDNSGYLDYDEFLHGEATLATKKKKK